MISRMLKLILALGLMTSASALMGNPSGGDVIMVQDVGLRIPTGWSLHQNARDQGLMILGFKNNGRYLRLYVAPRLDISGEDIFLSRGAELLAHHTSNNFSLAWERLHTRYAAQNVEKYISAFMLKHNGYTYYGYSASESLSQSDEAVNSFLSQMN